MIERGGLVDFLVIENESMVIVGDELLRLGPIATAIVEILHTPLSFNALCDQLVQVFGPPPGGGLVEAVREQVRELTERGVLVGEPDPTT